MSNYPSILLSLLRRGLVAAAFFAVGTAWLLTARGWSDIGILLVGMAAYICGALCIASPIARIIAEPSGGLFFPGDRFDRPQPMYGIPESRRKEGDYEAAFEGFLKISEDYPQELQAYIAMIDTAAMDLHDPDRVAMAYDAGMATLKKPEDCRALKTMYAAILSRAALPSHAERAAARGSIQPRRRAPEVRLIWA